MTAISEITSDKQVRELSDEELLNLHHRLHQTYGAARARGEATEYPWVNVHLWVVEEMERRGMHHHVHDDLDRETERLRKGEPAASDPGRVRAGTDGSARDVPEWIARALERAEDMVLVPAYISVVGSAVSSDDPGDLDILVREDYERVSRGLHESLSLLVRKLLDPQKRGLKLHMLYNAQGPHVVEDEGYVPLFDLVLRPRKAAKLVTVEMGGLRQPLRSPGGKTRIARKLLPLIPPHKVYVEPFAGGAALFWRKEPSEREVLNDINPDIMAVYKFLRDATDEELEEFAKRDWVGRESLFDRLANEHPRRLIDRAYRTWYLSRFGYHGPHSEAGNFLHVDEGQRADVNIERLRKLRERLKGVVLENTDALDVIRRYDSPTTFFYIDPPSLGADAGYKYGPDPKHLAELGKLLRRIKGKALVSGNAETIKALDLPSSWHVKRILVPYSMDWTVSHFERRYELVAANYPIAKAAPSMPDWERWLEQAPEGLWVDLGPGDEKPEGFLGVGYGAAAEIVADLDCVPWPLADESVAVLRANHVLEHLSDPAAVMLEVWRVLKPGGLFIATTPAAGTRGDYAHPEHRSHWSADTFRLYASEELLATVELKPPEPFELLYLDERERGEGIVDVDVVLRKPMAEAVAEAIGKDKRLKPIAVFKPPKPAQKGRAHTDAFSPDEIWPWVEKHLDAGVVAEPKLNGFRAIVQHDGHGKISIRFEDSLQERYKALVRVDERLRKLEELPACILDCDVGVVEGGHRWPRPRLMTLTAKRPELPEGARIAITAFDLLYWDGDDVHDRPFRERRALLEQVAGQLRKVGIEITPQMPIKTKADLERAWRSPKFGLADRSEGIVLKALGWRYNLGPSTDGMAKIKHALEVKAIVLEVKRTKGGSWNFRGGLLPGKMEGELANLVEFRGQRYVDLGFSYNSEFEAKPGDIVTFEVEEITWDQADRRLNWLGAKPMDVDRERSEPYYARQVIDLARRARVLQEVPVSKAKGEDGETRGEAALRNWEEHWHEAMPTSGKALPFVLHAHWRGLTEEEAQLSMEELLKTNNSLHFDLRLGTDRFDGWWGITLFAGTTAENRDELRIFRMMHDPDEKLESAPKQFGPAAWLKVGLKEPLIVPPGGVGSTSRAWSAFFAIDHGTWRLGFARQHAVEIWLDGQHLKGRFLWQYAPLEPGGPRHWLFTRPADQRPYAETHDLDEAVQELAEKGQKWLFWPKDPKDLSKGLERIDVEREARKLRKYFVIKEEEEKRYTLGVAYPANRVDAHGDYTTPEELEKAAWEFAKRIQEGRASIGLMHLPGTEGAGTVVESYIYRGPTWEINGQVVQPGDWLLGVIWSEEAWKLIKAGKITGYSIQGMARKE